MNGYSVWHHASFRPSKAPRLLYAGPDGVYAAHVYERARRTMLRGRLSLVRIYDGRRTELASRRQGAK